MTLTSDPRPVSDTDTPARVPMVLRDLLEETENAFTVAREEGEVVSHMRIVAKNNRVARKLVCHTPNIRAVRNPQSDRYR